MPYGIVYGLYDSAARLRYIGQTVQSTALRLEQHLRDKRDWTRTHRGKWVAACVARGEKIQLRALGEAANKESLDLLEIFHVAHARASATKRLTNTENGGRGRGKVAEETKAKISASRTGYVMPEVSKEKLRKRQFSAETLAKMSAAHKGKPSPRKGVRLSPATLTQMSLATGRAWAAGRYASRTRTVVPGRAAEAGRKAWAEGKYANRRRADRAGPVTERGKACRSKNGAGAASYPAEGREEPE